MSPGTESIFSFSHRAAVILVLDVVGSTRLLEHDESGYIRRWRGFVHEAIEHVLPAHAGRFHKSTGDGLMLQFGLADQAVAAAFELQRLCRAASSRLPPAQQIELRIAANVADCVEDEYDLYGRGVHLAARLLDLARPGEVVVTDAVRRLLRAGRAECDDLGERRLRHVRAPVRVWRLRPATARRHPGSEAPQHDGAGPRGEHPMAPGAGAAGA